MQGSQLVAAWQPGSRAARKWRENEEMERDSHFIFPLFSPSLSISCIKNSLILTQNVKYGTFVANVLKNLWYVLWEKKSPQVVPAWVIVITIFIVVIMIIIYIVLVIIYLEIGKYFRDNVEVELWRANFIKAVLFRAKIWYQIHPDCTFGEQPIDFLTRIYI